jgi:hypothetical protein
MIDTIILQNKKCILRFGSYNNMTIEITAYNEATGSLCTVPTGNFEKEYGPAYSEDFLFPFVVIKNYGDAGRYV